jgi:TonB-dependent SusC/RagA subfamily outer membrane receptor
MTIQRLLTRLVTFILLCVLFTQTAFSQNKTITGKILDDKGAPVQGATVSVKGQKAATSTAADGTFRLAIPAGGTDIVVSSVGFTPQTLSIGTQETMNVSLVPSTLGLNEVVVVGYQAVRKKDVTGSVTSVTAKDFNQGAITSPDQLLQNKVAGLEIVNNNGAPGAGTTVKIRGSSSLRASNNPLYVIDGVALDGRTAKPDLDLGRNGLPFGSTPESNPLLYINPADIQQIDVLKDASATAIYGSRGANGIIIITTKKGTGGALKVDAGVNFGFNAGYMKSYGLLTASEFRDLSLKNNLKQDSGATVASVSAAVVTTVNGAPPSWVPG